MRDDLGRLLRVPEAAVRLGLKPSTIRRLILERRIAVVRPSVRSVRIAEKTIDEIVAQGYRPAVHETRK